MRKSLRANIISKPAAAVAPPLVNATPLPTTPQHLLCSHFPRRPHPPRGSAACSLDRASVERSLALLPAPVVGIMDVERRAPTAQKPRSKVSTPSAQCKKETLVFNTCSLSDQRTFSQMASGDSPDLMDTWSPYLDMSISPGPSSPPRSLTITPVSNPHTPGSNAPSSTDGVRLRRRRGYDYRRPTPSNATTQNSAAANVIDLTMDDEPDESHLVVPMFAQRRNSLTGPHAQRLPRFAREIIDVDDDEQPPANLPRRDSSSDVEFIAARPLDGAAARDPPT
ncbi:MAG: hypothetical protein INR71_11350, partial [Terriglobus roseus]|nr:hypothetical protein [Terriglobus roseus]